jgi:hypothetical protein
MGALMRSWLFGLACLATLAGTAHAQALKTVGTAGSQVTFGPTSNPPGTTSFPAGAGVLANTTGSGAAFDSLILNTPTTVSFESGDAASGGFVRSVSTISLDLTVTNTTTEDLLPLFRSTIVPEGLGFYLADQTGGCGGNIYTGCPQSLSSWALSDLRLPTGSGAGDPLARVGFDFQVLAGGAPVYQLAGSMNLVFDPLSGQTNVVQNLAGPAAALSGFRQTTPVGSNSAIGFGWDATNFNVGPLAPLAPGQSVTFTYLVTVESLSHALCLDSVTCLVAYSGFGDPVGRGGGVTSALNLAGLNVPGAISGLQFQPFVFDAPTLQGGVLTFQGHQGAAIPEPATWVSLLLGAGLAGAALRRRRALA